MAEDQFALLRVDRETLLAGGRLEINCQVVNQGELISLSSLVNTVEEIEIFLLNLGPVLGHETEYVDGTIRYRVAGVPQPLNKCPHCGSKDLDCGDPKFCDCGSCEDIVVEITCDTCYHEWDERYRFLENDLTADNQL